MLPDRFVPNDVPKPLLYLLIIINLLLGASGMRYGGVEGVLHTLENWLILLVFLPLCTTLVALPVKWRDSSFDLKLAYYMGMFVALLFMLGKLRYWR